MSCFNNASRHCATALESALCVAWHVIAAFPSVIILIRRGSGLRNYLGCCLA